MVKSPSLLLSLLLLLTVCFFLHQSPSLTARMGIRRLLDVQHNSENRGLEQLLKGMSMSDRTIILSIINQELTSPGSIFDLFLESFRLGEGTKRFLNHLLIVATDKEAYRYCKSLHPHCFPLGFSNTDYSTEDSREHVDQLMIRRIKNEFILEVLGLAYNILFTDADVMWLRTPFQHMNPLSDMSLARKLHPKGFLKPDSGFFYARSSDLAIEFFRCWKATTVLYPNSNDDHLYQTILTDPMFNMDGFRVQELDTTHFGGFCQLEMDISEISTLHANCCNNVEDKVHDLKLVLDYWRNFTSQSNERVNLGIASNFTWKTPLRCLR